MAHELRGTKCPNCNTLTQEFVALFLSDSLSSSHIVNIGFEDDNVITVNSGEETNITTFFKVKDPNTITSIHRQDIQSLQKRLQSSMTSLNTMN